MYLKESRELYFRNVECLESFGVIDSWEVVISTWSCKQ